MKYKRHILWFTFMAMLFAAQVQAQSYRDMISRTFSVNASTAVEIDNKYGKVHINTWNRDSVMFEIDLRIKASNNEKLDKLKHSVDFDFTQTKYYVVARTQFQNRTKNLLGDLIDIAESIVNSENQIVIDYTVYLPSYATLTISNKFGDVYIDDYKGNITLNLGYGDLKANNLSGNTDLNLNSSDAIVNKIVSGRAEAAYSDFTVNEAGELDLETRSSNVYIKGGDNLKIESSRDKYYINNIKELRGETYFSVFDINGLTSGLNLTQKYGKTMVYEIDKSFSYINLTSNYTDIDLGFNHGSAFLIDLFHHADVVFTYPHNNVSLEEELIDKEEEEYMLYGTIGNKASARSKVKVSALKKCNFSISIK